MDPRNAAPQKQASVAPLDASCGADTLPSPARLVRVPDDGPNAPLVAAVLARHGAVGPLGTGPARLYAMPSESARSEALDDVRSRFGWTAAEPAR